MIDKKERPVSPVNGQPIPKGKPFTTSDERARLAGKKSGERRTQRKSLREELIALLTEQVTDKNSGRKMETQQAMSTALINQALRGNTKAFEIIRDTIGEKPIENVNVVMPDYSALEKAFSGIEDKK